MTDTAKTSRLLAGLDEAERAHTAAFALARKFLAEPDASRPIVDIEVEHHRYPRIVTVSVTAGNRAPHAVTEAALEAWAEFLGGKVVTEQLGDNPRDLHFFATGEHAGTRVRVWAVADVPIADAVITQVRKRYRITYQQRGEQHQVVVASMDEALNWVHEHVTPAVPAC